MSPSAPSGRRVLKKMKWAPQGLDRVAEWKRLVGATPLFAIGGLTPERGRACLDAGADIVSVVTDITLNPDPEARTREWIAATRHRPCRSLKGPPACASPSSPLSLAALRPAGSRARTR